MMEGEQDFVAGFKQARGGEGWGSEVWAKRGAPGKRTPEESA